MSVLPVWIKRPWDVSVQRPQDADARMHQGTTIFRGHDQRFGRCLPLLELLFFPGQRMNVFAGVTQGDELALVGEGDWIRERS